jgi:mevalonate kinase
MKKSATGTSHAKVILTGEHAVVYNQPAIALPLPDMSLTVSISERNHGQIVLAPGYQGPLTEMAEMYEGVRQLIVRLLHSFSAPDLAFKLKITSTIPEERGMGSSAATAVAITRAFFNYFEAPLSNAELQKWASIEESITHGSSSGIDAATVAHDVPIWFIKGQEPTTMPMDLSATLIIADTGIHGQTGLAVSVVRQHLMLGEDNAQERIEQLGHISAISRDALANNDIQQLGSAMNDAQTHLSALGVSHPELDKLVMASRNAGALGAKLTGGGVGGAMLALTDTPETTAAVITALETAGAREIWVQSYPQG